jgi:hypothetical protein
VSFPDWARRRINRWPELGEVMDLFTEDKLHIQVWRHHGKPNVVVFVLLDDINFHIEAIFAHEIEKPFDPLAAYPVAEEARRADQVTR